MPKEYPPLPFTLQHEFDDSALRPVEITAHGYVVKGFPPREAEALAATANGYTSKETAALMGISPASVEQMLGKAKARINAKNKSNLVFLALAYGLLVKVDPKNPAPQE